MKAEEVLKNWSDKTGGKARTKVRNRVLNGIVEIPLLHIRGPITVYAAAPGNRYEVWELSAGQGFERGCDGMHAWNVRNPGGAQLIPEASRSAVLREAAFNLELCWQDHFKSVETVAVRTAKRLAVGNQPETERPCFELKMTPKDGGDPELWYIDTENFQRMATITKLREGDQVMDRITLYADYRPVNDVLEPFIVHEQVGVQRQLIRYTSIQHNVRMSKYRFEMPEEIRKQIGSSAAEGPTSAPTTTAPAPQPGSSEPAKTPGSSDPPKKNDSGR